MAVIPKSRSYVHDQCGHVTEVDGGDFKNVSCPVPGMKGTMCAACGSLFPISEFKWKDSDESIEAYYARHRVRVPAMTRLICSRPVSIAIVLIGFLAGIGLGVWIWNSFGVCLGLVGGVISSLIGFVASMLIWDSIRSRLLSTTFGVPDTRCLK